MTLPNQLAEASKAQLAKQIDFFQALTSRAFDNAERIVALNLQATLATLEHTSGAVRQLAAVRDPRELFALGQPQQQMEAVLAYGRQLMEIANKPAPVPEEHIVTAPPVMVSEPVPETAPVAAAEPAQEPAPEPAPAHASTVAPSEHPLGEADPAPVPAPLIDAEPTPIARAASEFAAALTEIPHPAASPIPDADTVQIPTITPDEAGIEPASAPPKRAKPPKKR